MDALPENLRHSDQHDYLSSAEMKPMVQEVQTQTDMTCEDIASLVKASTRKFKSRAEDTVDCVLDSDERVNFYTGLESRTLLNGVWDSISDGVSKMKYWTGPESMKEKQYEKKGYKKPGQQRHLDPFFEFVMTLMRIRLNLPLLLLADLFSVSATCVTKTTITWIAYLHQTLVPALLIWPSQLQVRSRMPFEFKKYFPRTRVVIDCTEFFIDRPANKKEQYRTYSQYKSHNTYKCLVGINPNGAFTFVSDFWGGNVSDKFLTQNSGLLEKLEEGDQVMADRGFHIEDLLLYVGSTLVAPPFTRKWTSGKGKRLNVEEINRTRLIARLRIHVERAIQRIKTFRILKHQIPHSLKDMSSMLVQVVAAICNLKGPLFYSHGDPKSGQSKRKKPLKRLHSSPRKGIPDC
nr:uncharacterized protein LOC129274430 isoform X2 [Lytechinus pictus]